MAVVAPGQGFETKVEGAIEFVEWDANVEAGAG